MTAEPGVCCAASAAMPLAASRRLPCLTSVGGPSQRHRRCGSLGMWRIRAGRFVFCYDDVVLSVTRATGVGRRWLGVGVGVGGRG